MASMWRVIADWTGGKIGTGYTNLYFTGGVTTPQACADAAREFFRAGTTIGGYLPSGVAVGFRSTVDVVDSTDGRISTVLPVTAPAPVTGAGSAAYASLAGACVTWRTADYKNGRRVRGRTFLVPLDGGAYQADGTLGTSFLTSLNTAAAALISAAPELCIWHRPSGPGAVDGSLHAAISGASADRAAYLASRR